LILERVSDKKAYFSLNTNLIEINLQDISNDLLRDFSLRRAKSLKYTILQIEDKITLKKIKSFKICDKCGIFSHNDEYQVCYSCYLEIRC